MAKTREYTCKLLEMMDDGLVDPRILAESLLAYMSEREVMEFFISEGYGESFEECDDEV